MLDDLAFLDLEYVYHRLASIIRPVSGMYVQIHQIAFGRASILKTIKPVSQLHVPCCSDEGVIEVKHIPICWLL